MALMTFEQLDRSIDADSDSDDEDVNPLESTPTHIPENSFPKGTKFTSVAAGDSCSFAVTDTGLVYGWGTFLVSSQNPHASLLPIFFYPF